MIDASAGGALMKKTTDQAYEILEDAATNTNQWPREKATPVNTVGGTDNAVPNNLVNHVAQLTKQLNRQQGTANAIQTNPWELCEFCGGQHSSVECQSGNPTVEQAQYVLRFNQNQTQQQGPYGGNNYQNQNQGQGWRNNQNQNSQTNQGYGWRNNQNNMPSNRANETPSEKKLDLEQALAQMLTSHSAFMNETKANMQQQATQLNNQAAQLRSLEAQLGQMANLLTERQPGSLPSNSEVNPRRDGNEHVKAVTLRSGKELESQLQPPVVEQLETEEITQPERKDDAEKEQPQEKQSSETSVETKASIPVPYPQRLKKHKLDKQFTKFMDVFKKLHINIPFSDALEQMPSYVKFMKDILSQKRRLADFETMNLTEECSAILQRKLPQKLKDPGSFTISCTIGNAIFERALCDLGARINLMPLSIFMRFGLGEARPTTVTLQLADRSLKHPRGIIEDVLVKVDKFIFPTDFIVLDMEEDKEIPIILGRPFLATGRAMIDVQRGELKLRVQEEEVKFIVFEAVRHPAESDTCFMADIVEAIVSSQSGLTDPLETSLVENASENLSDEAEEYVKWMDSFGHNRRKYFESLGEGAKPPVPSIEHPPKMEQKPLPSHLKYAYLGVESTLPVIISSSLTAMEEEKLLRVLRDHKQALGWSLANLKGIRPSMCMHRILLEDDHKPLVEAQRRLNPTMKEVVRKEVLKWLDTGVIYPISDSAWVSPVQVVPKKGGTTVIKTENNILLPSRTVTGSRICIDYRKLNKATRKDHFPLPFLDQMLDRLAGYEYYCFLDGYSGYNQIAIAPEDQEKTTFTCPYGTFAFRRMPFGLCNAPGTFQRCMMAIFSDMVEKTIEIFMDDFSVMGNSFDNCLKNLRAVLARCEETNLVLNWEKCHFMVQEGIVLGHRISARGIEVDKAKIEAIEKLPPPSSVKGIRSFLGHAGFYRRFIKDFSQIAKPLSNLLVQGIPFEFDSQCLHAFTVLKDKLISAPIVVAPNWSFPFELMCDASDYAIGAVLGQKREKIFHVIYYASRTLNDAQLNYATTEKELLAIVFAFEKFRPYLIGNKVVVHTDHSAIKYLMTKKDAKPRLIRWVLLLQEFDVEIKDKKGTENLVADYLSRLDGARDDVPVNDEFPDEKLFANEDKREVPWFADYVNYLVAKVIPPEFNYQKKKRFFAHLKHYYWEEPILYRHCADQVIRRCVPEDEMHSILNHCHTLPCGGHFGGQRTAAKVLQSGFYWPSLFKDAHQFVSTCDKCQRMGNISRKDEPPMHPILEVELFDLWGIDFMGPFPASYNNLYILLAVDYVSKWVEAIPTRTNDAKVVAQFLRSNIFSRFGTPRALITDNGTHFCNKVIEKVLQKYGVRHRTSLAYHPNQTGKQRYPTEKSSTFSKRQSTAPGRIGLKR